MKFKKFIKKNSVPLVLFVLLLMIVVAVLLFIGLFVPSNKNGTYGNRLEGIEDYPIEASTLEQVKTLSLKDKNFTDVTTKVQGRIIYIHLYTETLNRENAQKASEVVFDVFTDKQKSYYDFQIVVKNESKDESKAYVMFGSRNHGSETTIWTNYE